MGKFMDIKNYINKDYSRKEKYEYYLSLGYGEKAASVLAIFNYGNTRNGEFLKSFDGDGILDKIYDIINL